MNASNHRPKKHLGQHFLSDPEILSRIVRAIRPKPQPPMLEIGPGLGALTTALLPLCQNMTAIEKDQAVIAPLQAQCDKLGSCDILHADVMDVDLATLLSQPTRIVGNLPYQISSPLLFKCFDHLDTIVDMHFMLQKEVAERIAAKPNTQHYGRLSVMAQFYCEATICFHVPPEAFTPPPRVQSSFIRLTPHATPLPGNPDHLATWVTLAFQQRRKKCRNSLKKHLSEQQQEQLAPWAEARPETLSVTDFIHLSQALGPPTL